MYFLMILSLLGEITGETFFHQQEHGNLVLQCNQPVAKESKRTDWYKTADDMQQFELINCSSKCNHLCTETVCNETLEVARVSSAGRMFACGALSSDEEPMTSLLFSNASHCRRYSFFLVQTKTESGKKSSGNVQEKSQVSLKFKETDNITLSCEFYTNCSGHCFFMYWIRVSKTSECLFSAANEALAPSLTFNEHCCVDRNIQERLLNNTNFNSTHKRHNMTILNVTSADSGQYLCIVAAWQHGKLEWQVPTNRSVDVQKDQTAPMQWHVISGAVAGIIFLNVTVGLICLKIFKSKGKKTTTQVTRDHDAIGMTEDECSPYAVSGSSDMYRNESLYSRVTRTCTEPNGPSSSPDNRATGAGQGADIRTVYALLNK
ncbi:uncharacterized protein [Apteryx mantelli]|uniref:Ig-like domain-containing protein n=1 Tax=Apteryx mantelli TaxID=2696672 RepID=A0ABM4F9H6_9AVES|nr:uncharacterized protein LOC112974736 [Apteryx rowi]